MTEQTPPPEFLIAARLMHLGHLSTMSEKAAEIINDLRVHGYVCVPLEPTKEMLKAAWADALAEDAAGVWESMIEEWISRTGGETVSTKEG